MAKSATKELVVTLDLSIGSDPIEKQLAALGLVAKSPMDYGRWKKIYNAIWCLNLHGYLPKSKRHSSLQKLYKEICRGVKIKDKPAKAKGK